MTALTGRGLIRRGLAGSTVTAMSLASRVLALLLLVPAARLLPVEDFGVFSLALGLAIAAANVVGSAPADITATAAVADPDGTRRRVLWIVVALAVTEGALVLAATMWMLPHPIVLLTVATGLSAVGPVLAMNVLRGAGRPALGAALPYLAVPLARCAAAELALWTGTDLTGLMAAVAASGIVAGLACVVVLASVPVATAPILPSPQRPDARRRGLAFLAGAAVSVTWMLLAQGGTVALSVTAGPAVVAAFVPTARVCESLTAIGIGYKAAATQRLHGTRDGRLPRGALLTLLGVFVAAGCAVLGVAPWAVPAVFGPELRFLTVPAVALVASAACSALVAVKLQALFAARRYRRILVATGWAAVLTALLVGAGTAILHVDGAAAATATAVGAWMVLLSVRTRTDRGLPC